MKIIEIIYFVHATTIDNERGLATGWEPGQLSSVGIKQAIKSSMLLENERYDIIFCSDLKRAVDTANLLWGDSVKIIFDERLRECNYGDLTKNKSSEVKKQMVNHVTLPFPNGESYKEVEERIRNFLDFLASAHIGKKVAIVSHQAPQLALEVITKGKTWQQAINEDWRNKKSKKWRLGWIYIIDR
jgi:broad specificity phosphatase PhoE